MENFLRVNKGRKLDGSKIFFQWKLEGRNDSPLKIFSM